MFNEIIGLLHTVDAFNRARLRQPLGPAAPSCAQILSDYTLKRETGIVDYPLLHRALDDFGINHLGPVVRQMVDTYCPPAVRNRTVDLGCGSAWLTKVINPLDAILVDRPEALKDVTVPGYKASYDLEDSRELETLNSILVQRGTKLALVGEVLHCLDNPAALLAWLPEISYALIVEQEDNGTTISRQLKADFGPDNHLPTQQELFGYMDEWTLVSYIRLRQYSLGLWRRED